MYNLRKENTMGKRKYTFNEIYNYFKENDCKLLSTEYINSKSKLKYLCSCGNISYIIWNDFQQGKRCSICAKNKKYTLKEVDEFLSTI